MWDNGTERWITVPNHPYYEVSTFGRVRSNLRPKVVSCARINRAVGDETWMLKGKLLQPTECSHSYRVWLHSEDGARTSVVLGYLVAWAWLRPEFSTYKEFRRNYIVRHVDGNRLNCALSNLIIIPRN